MLFKYKGFDKTGKKVKGTVTASSEEEAGQKLRTQNIYLTENPYPFGMPKEWIHPGVFKAAKTLGFEVPQQ